MRSANALFAVVLAAGMFATRPAAADNLFDALAAAYTNNPTLQAQRASVRATDEQVPQALSDWRPTVEIDTSAGVQAFQTNTATGTARNQHRDPRSLSLTVTQPLFDGGQTVAATSEAESNVLAARARLTSVEQDVLFAGVVAYMNVLRDQAVLDLNINNEQVLGRQSEATNDRFRVGEITRTDVFQAESRLATATADRIQAEGNLATSRAIYLNVIGMPPQSLVAASAPDDLPTASSDAVASAIRSAPDVVAAEYDTRASSHNIDQVKGELLPSLELEGAATTALETSGEGARTENYQAILSLSVPLYQSGAVYSRLREAKQLAGQRRLLVDAERRSAIEDATTAWEALQTARAQIVAFQKGIDSARIALEGVQSESDVGSRTVLDVLDAEQELLDARVGLVLAQRDEVVAAYQLKSAMGDLTAAKLGLAVDLYRPDIHYEEVRDKWFGGSSSGEYEVDDLP